MKKSGLINYCFENDNDKKEKSVYLQFTACFYKKKPPAAVNGG
jgi:hypothetical protein